MQVLHASLPISAHGLYRSGSISSEAAELSGDRLDALVSDLEELLSRFDQQVEAVDGSQEFTAKGKGSRLMGLGETYRSKLEAFSGRLRTFESDVQAAQREIRREIQRPEGASSESDLSEVRSFARSLRDPVHVEAFLAEAVEELDHVSFYAIDSLPRTLRNRLIPAARITDLRDTLLRQTQVEQFHREIIALEGLEAAKYALQQSAAHIDKRSGFSKDAEEVRAAVG
jgi:hypothetical protein